MKKIYLKNQRGSVIIIFSLLLPAILLLISLVIDGGHLFVAKARMQGMLDNAASAGISVIGDQIVQIVKLKKASDPDLVVPTNLSSLLSPTEKTSLSKLDEVHTTIREYLIKNNIYNYNLDNIHIDYPYNSDTLAQIQIKISFSQTIKNYFPLFPDTTLESQSIASLNLNS